MKNFPTCQALIWLDSKGRANTYCMRPLGHEGGHAMVSTKEDAEKAQTEIKAEILEKMYGPYAKDDTRARRGF